MVKSFSVTTDAETESRVRTVTGYEDTDDELPSADLSDVLDAAKARLYSATGDDSWYSDHHLGEALVYTAAITAKERLENYSVEQWSIGNGAESVTVRGASQDEGQILSWVQQVETNVANSTATSGAGTFRLTTRPERW